MVLVTPSRDVGVSTVSITILNSELSVDLTSSHDPTEGVLVTPPTTIFSDALTKV